MSRPRAQLAVAGVALILGFLVVLQIRAQDASSQLGARSSQELTLLVANLDDRNDQLRAEVATLEQDLRELQAAKARGESSLGDLDRDLRRLRSWAGLDGVTGPGVSIRVTGDIGGEGVMDLLNELRNAGAEAIAVDGTRLLARTVVAGPIGALSVDDRVLADPFMVDAIGSPEALTGSLTRAGGVVALLAATYPDAEVTVTPVEGVVIAATEVDLRPSYGTPRL
jgi:uncharacterized protein YlxW (UPF0749 family)